MKLLKSVFSVKNIDVHKVITVAGIKIKFKNKKLFLISKIKKLEQKLKNSQKKIISYTKKIDKLKNQIKEKNSILKDKKLNYEKIIQDKNIIIENTNEKLNKTISQLLEFRQQTIKTIDEYLQDRLEYLNKNIKDNSNITFSVIMPTYNRAYCIKNAIDSVLNQTHQNFELIIADDASTDNTEELIKTEYKKELEEKKIIYKKLEKNGGSSFARNEALKAAKNDWIAYLDTDNTIRPYFLSEFAFNISKNTNTVYYAAFQKSSGAISNNTFDYNKLLKANYIDMGILVHHKSLVEKYGDFDIKLSACNDWDLVLRYTKDNIPFHIPVVLMDYKDTDSDNIRLTSDEKKRLSDIEIIVNRYSSN